MSGNPLNDPLNCHPNPPLVCLKKENCVYVPVLKAASTYFENLLVHNEWQPIDYNHINWNKNFVFGFIMDPLTRYFKAVAHEILANLAGFENLIEKTKKELYNKDRLFLLYTTHTIPITTVYEDRHNDIHWIVLDGAHDAVIDLQNLLNSHNIELNVPKNLHANKSDKAQNKVYENIQKLYENDHYLLSQLLKNDMKLYHSVLANS